MAEIDLSRLTVEASRLQTGYAQAIDTRDWNHFRTVFTSDVIAEYPNSRYEGMDEWLTFFIPFHDGCTWTQHVMTNHFVAEDAQGVWASCYGSVQWIRGEAPNVVHRAEALYQDRLLQQDERWLIAHRRLDLVMTQSVEIPEGLTFPISILDCFREAGTQN